MSGALTLVSACAGEPEPTQVIPSHESGALTLLIEREGSTGLFVEGTAENFRVTAAGEVFKSVRWSATAGTVAPSEEHVTWTLPSKGRASLTVSVETESGRKAESEFHFNVVSAAATAVNTAIDMSPDVTGGFCELTFDAAGRGHIVYFNDSHRSLWYGLWDGTSWTTEQIDGSGFNNGGQFTYNPVIAVDPATGTPHVAYLKGDGEPGRGGETLRVAYATRVNGVWVRELVDPTNRGSSVRLSIALHPTQGLQPVIVYSDPSSGVRVATRTGSNAWSIPQVATGSVSSEALFDAAGTLYVVNKGVLNAIKGSVVETFPLGGLSTVTGWFSLAMAPSQHLLALPNGASTNGAWVGFYDVTLGTPLSTSTVRTSLGDFVNHSNDLAYGGGKPFFAQRHGTTLELVTPDAQGFWTFTQLGTIQDGTRPSIAIRPTDGTPHVCYQRDGKVTFQ